MKRSPAIGSGAPLSQEGHHRRLRPAPGQRAPPKTQPPASSRTSQNRLFSCPSLLNAKKPNRVEPTANSGILLFKIASSSQRACAKPNLPCRIGYAPHGYNTPESKELLLAAAANQKCSSGIPAPRAGHNGNCQ